MCRIALTTIVTVFVGGILHPAAAALAGRTPAEAKRPVSRRLRAAVAWPLRLVTLRGDVDAAGELNGTVSLVGFVSHPLDWPAVLEEVFGAPVEVIESRPVMDFGRVKDGSARLPFRYVVTFRSSCAVRRQWFERSLQVDVGPLARALSRRRPELFGVEIACPSAGVPDFPRRRQLVRKQQSFGTTYASYRFRRDEVLQGMPLKFRWGYRTGDIVPRLAVLAFVLLLPVVIALWLRARALRRSAFDRAAAWFGYCKRLQGTIVALSIGWAVLVLSPWIKPVASFVTAGWNGQLQTAVLVGVLILPAVAVHVVIAALSYPVYTQVRRAAWTRMELVRQVMWREAVVALPVMFCVMAIGAYGDHMPRMVVLWLFGAYVSWILASRRLAAATIPALHVVTTGPLHDRIIGMATQAGVKLDQVIVLETAKCLEANAAAIRTWGGQRSVLLTDHLVRRLDRAEVDAIVAHELAHLKLRHGGHPLIVFCVSMTIVIAASAVLALKFHWNPDDFFVWTIPAIFLLPTLWNRFRSRRQERAADAEALELTDHPAAHITSLVRITHLGLMPLRWGRINEPWQTHPSTQRRIERIGFKAGIPPSRVEELARRVEADLQRQATTEEDDPQAIDPSRQYELPAELLCPDRVFTTQFKLSAARRVQYAAFCLLCGVPVGILALLGKLELPWARSALAGIVVAAVGASAAVLAAMNVLAVAGFADLRRRLADRLQTEGIDVESVGGRFVSFAPAGTPRFFEGFSNWDVGFLFTFDDRIVYVGDRVRFALRRDQIGRLALCRAGVGPAHPRRAGIEWRDEDGVWRTWSFGLAERRTLGGLRRAAPGFLQALLQWQAKGTPSPRVPDNLAEVGPPQIGEVSSHSPRAAFNVRGLLWSMVILALLTAGASYLAGLSLRRPSGSGWQAVFAACVGLYLLQAPYQFYRDPQSADRPVRVADDEASQE